MRMTAGYVVFDARIYYIRKLVWRDSKETERKTREMRSEFTKWHGKVYLLISRLHK